MATVVGSIAAYTPYENWQQYVEQLQVFMEANDVTIIRRCGMSTKHIACIASVDVINFIPYLLLSSFCIESFIFHVQISSIPIMIIQTILAPCFSILSVVALDVRLLVSAIFNPNPHGRSVSVCTEDPRPPTQKSASTCTEDLQHPCRRSALFHTTTHGCLRRTTSEFLRKS